ncbi:MAG: hypothetical protein A2Z21_09075 [Candidatus Fraserbacteria bacterium RBG_16_55_9]|uniref:Uncharacterized protein n=1 Tax=Fraserbacteria sp. (strain RBG_16_55_9) TaxID=1817864 RepID=A0A1F5UUH9_FRAXR|nr:MAG: hypothetical protein A2Z21_09075 [Candidatus Fraserbacteria bacterium RBG_16_55_9]
MTRRQVCLLLIVFSFLIGGCAYVARADLTGTSFITILAEPIPCTLVGEILLETPCEKTLLKFDIESIINLTVTLSGMSFTIDSAVGITGVEHLILTSKVTLGMVDLTSEFWVATPFESVVDVNLLPNVVVIPPGNPLFVKQRITTSLTLGGLAVSNLAIFEDVTFPNPGADYGVTDCDGDGAVEGTCVKGIQTNPANQYQTQSFAFGDIITVAGQTPSGISISGSTGLCATGAGNSVKKHSAPGSVNPDCVDSPKPRFFFDFETISISGIKLAQGLSMSTVLRCVNSDACGLTNTFGFTGGPIPFSTSLVFQDLFHARFSGVSVSIPMGAVTINASINDQFQIASASLLFSSGFSAGNLSGRFSSTINFVKGSGLTGMTMGLTVATGTFSSSHSLVIVRDPIMNKLKFGSLTISMGVNLAPFRLSLQTTFGKAGLANAGVVAGLIF